MALIRNSNPQPVPEVKVDANPPAVAPVVKKPAPVVDEKMSKAEWALKDRRISRQGLFQAALQSPALMQYSPKMEAYLELVIRTANVGLAYVNQED